jgi:hypothetical protein
MRTAAVVPLFELASLAGAHPKATAVPFFELASLAGAFALALQQKVAAIPYLRSLRSLLLSIMHTYMTVRLLPSSGR